MIDLKIKQSFVDESSDSALEEFKSAFADFLNNLPTDRHAEQRWVVTKVSEGDVARLIYDEQSIASFKLEANVLRFWSDDDQPARYDDLMYGARYVAGRLGLAVFSAAHGGARLPYDAALALDHPFFRRDEHFRQFFQHSQFAPRYCSERYETRGDQTVVTINQPFFLEDQTTGAIHLANDRMLDYLVQKDNQQTSPEFSYQVADSMDDFAKKYDAGLVPLSFYQYYNRPTKIINQTNFDIYNIGRKVFIDPYVWDFDAEHGQKFYHNVQNGLHLMDKVRRGETLDTAIKRVLREELAVADDYVGALIWRIDFDRDREGILTPRLVMNVYVHGLERRQRSRSHDWVSIK